MENIKTISRPYAKACFELCLEQNKPTEALNFWGQALQACSIALQSEAGKNIISTNKDYQLEVTNFLEAVLPKNLLTTEVRNFLKVLEKNSRFGYIHGIYDFFISLRQQYDLPVPVSIVSSSELTKNQLKQIEEKVAHKLNRNVQLDLKVDPSILSGIIIKTDDFIIDCSGRKTLENLRVQLTK